MPMERMPMRHLRDCLKLKNAGIAAREIARRVGVSPSTVRLALHRCEAAGISWPLGADLTIASMTSSRVARLFEKLNFKLNALVGGR